MPPIERATGVPALALTFVLGCAGTRGPAGPSGATGPTGGTTVVYSDGGVLVCVPGASVGCSCANGETGAQTCNDQGSFGVCTCTGGPDGGGSTGDNTGALTGQFAIVGGLSPSNMQVELQNVQFDEQASTNADGGYSYGTVPAGSYLLTARKSFSFADAGSVTMDYEATVPEFLYLPGGDGFFVSGALYPAATVEAPAKSQLASGEIYDAVASPDGNHLAYVIQHADSYDLQLVSASGGTPVDLGLVGALSFGFSPDSSYLAFVTNSANLEVVSTANPGNAPLMLGAMEYLQQGPPFQFSLDSQSVAFVSSAGTLEVAALPGGTTTPFGAEVINYQLLPGPKVAYLNQTAQDYGSLYLSTIPAQGTPSPIATDVYSGNLFASPDGAYFTFSALDGSFTYVRIADGTTYTYSQATAYAFSPDGSALLIVNSQSTYEWQFVTTSTGEAHTIAPYGGYQPTFSPDSTLLEFDNSEGTAQVFSTSDGSVTATLTNVDEVPLFSPDSTLLAYRSSATGTPLIIAPANGGTPVQLGTNPSYLIAFTSDSQHLLFLNESGDDTSASTLSVAPITGGTPTALMQNVYDFSLSPDGSLIAAYSESPTDFWLGQTSTVSILPVAGGTPIPLNAWSDAFFVNGAVVTTRNGTPAPYGFQDGVYLSTLAH